MFTITLFKNSTADADAIETIDNVIEVTIDSITPGKLTFRYRTPANNCESITREINPAEITLYIDEGEI